MKFALLFYIIFPCAWLSAQRLTINVPRDRPTDSIFLDVYHLYGVDSAGMEASRRYGWLTPSDKFDTDSFYRWTKQQCIDKVGEDFFYRNFKLGYYSFKNDPASEVYSITYLLAPFQDSTLKANDELYISFRFKRLDFLGRSETQIPANLPDCVTDAGLCDFRFDRAKVLALTQEKAIENQKVISQPHLQLRDDFSWQVGLKLASGGITHFRVDCRTGIMSEVKTSWPID